MINRSLSFAQRLMVSSAVSLPARYAAIAILTTMLALSGCQKNSEIDTVNDAPASNTVSVNAPIVKNTIEAPQTTSAEQAKLAPFTILALGDSLTEGLGVANDANYPAQLEARLQEIGYKNIKVINSGLSGETSTGMVNRLDWVLQTKPDITILTVGANDAIRGIDVATVDTNIRTAVKRLQNGGSQVILGGMQIYDNLGDDYVQSFAAMYPKIAKDMNITLIPFFLDGVGGDPKLNQADAIHPTSEGYTIIVNDNILPILKPEIEQMLATNDSNVPAKLQTTETPQ